MIFFSGEGGGLVQRPFQDFFSSYETGQLVAGAKTGEPPRKTTWLLLKSEILSF